MAGYYGEKGTLSPQKLGGVIFGATDVTFAECVDGLIFGEYSFFRPRREATHYPCHRKLVRCGCESTNLVANY